jgi:hypothetical protein
VRLYLAEADLLKKDFPAASKGYRDVLAIDPNNLLLSTTCLDARRDEGLLGAGFAEKDRLAPSPAIADTLGWLLVERGTKGVEISRRRRWLRRTRRDPVVLREGAAQERRRLGEPSKNTLRREPAEDRAESKQHEPVRHIPPFEGERMTTISVVGLGYVGLPLAVEFGKKFPTIGFDLSAPKVEAYRRHVDPTGEVSTDELRAASRLRVTTDPQALREADFVVVAVPTPIDEAHQPDFRPLLGASESVGRNLKRGAIVVSPLLSGATERSASRSSTPGPWKRDFEALAGRSTRATRSTRSRGSRKSSGRYDELERVAAIYASVVTAGVGASSIRLPRPAR